MSEPLRVLIVEDSENDALLTARELRRAGYDLVYERVDSAETFRDALAQQPWDLIIADYSLPQFDGLEALALLQQSALDLPFIIVSGTIGEDLAVEVMRAGAHDYVLKDNLTRLGPAVRRELGEAKIRRARKRSAQLLQTLNRAALAMERALTPEEIFAAVSKELGELDISGSLFLLSEDQEKLFVEYLSYDLAVIRSLEKLVGFRTKGFSIPLKIAEEFRQAVQDRETVLVGDAQDFMRRALPKSAVPFIKQLATILRVPQFIAAPLVVQDQAIGVFAVQAESLLEDDMPAVTAFAHQLAAAWRRAELFEHAQREIAERARAEEELRRSEAQYRMTLDSMGDAIHVIDSEMRFTLVNKTLEEWNAELDLETDMVGRTPFEVFPFLPDHVRDEYRRVFETGQTLITEEENIVKDLTIITETRKIPIFQDGSVIRVVTVIHDITQRKQSERALVRERDLVARVMETSPAGIIVLDRHGQITFANSRAERVLGLARDEITQRAYNAPDWRIADYDGGPFPDEELPFRRVMDTGEPVYDVRYAIQWPDGQRVLLSINSAPLLDPSGQVDRVVATVEDVTERLRAEEALRESEKKFRNIIESIPVGMHMYQLEPDGRLVFIDANPAADEILGVDNAQFLNKTIENAFPALADSEIPTQYRWVASTGETWRTDQVIYEEGAISGIFDVYAFQTSPGRMAAAFLDVTERTRTEEALRRYADRLETLHQIDQAILEARLPGEIAQVALRHVRRLVRCLGASVVMLEPSTDHATLFAAEPSGAFGDEMPARFSLEPLEGVAGVREILGDREFYFVDNIPALSLVTAGGQPLQVEGMEVGLVVPLVAQGELIGLLTLGAEHRGIFGQEQIDIIREVASELGIAIQNARLLEAERKRSAELEAIRQASLHLTSTLQLQSVLEAILEHALSLVSEDDAHVFLYDGDQLTFGAALWAGGMQREPFQPRPGGFTQTVAQDGERLVIPDVNSHPLFQDWQWGGAIVGLPLRIGDQVVGVMNIALNQSHHFAESELNVLGLLADQAAIAIQNARLHQQVQRHADDLSAALAQLQELDRLKNEFIQNVSHELRQPLALIRGYAELLYSGELGDLLPHHYEPVEVIHRRAQMLSELVEDITLILGTEARPLPRDAVDLASLAYAAVEDFEVAAEQAGLRLEAQIAPDLPLVGGASVYLRRVLDNLLSNAIKFTQPGGTITVRVWQEDGQVCLSVSDTGIGIPPDHQERIFERFYQVDGSSRRRYGGVGLGLALVKEVIEALGGQIDVRSQVDGGSTFTISLPANEEAED